MVDRREYITHQVENEEQQGNRLDIIPSIIAMSNNIIRLDADNDLLDNVGLGDDNYYEYTNNLVCEDHIVHRDNLVYEKDLPQSSNDPIYGVYEDSEFEIDSLDYGSDDLDDDHQVYEVKNLQEDISDDVIRPHVRQYVRTLMEDLRNMPARAHYEDVQVNQEDSLFNRDYDEYTINDPDEEQDNLDDEAEDDEDEEDQGEEDEGQHFIFILVDVYYPVGLYTTFLLYTPKINVLKQPFKEIKKKRKKRKKEAV